MSRVVWFRFQGASRFVVRSVSRSGKASSPNFVLERQREFLWDTIGAAKYFKVTLSSKPFTGSREVRVIGFDFQMVLFGGEERPFAGMCERVFREITRGIRGFDVKKGGRLYWTIEAMTTAQWRKGRKK